MNDPDRRIVFQLVDFFRDRNKRFLHDFLRFAFRQAGLPGGTVESNESPRAAAVREIREELGLSIEPGRLLAVDWVPPRQGRTEGLTLVFDGGQLPVAQVPAIQLPPDELRCWAWCTPEEEATRLSPRLARRASVSRQARAGGWTAYREDGHPVI